MNSYYMNANLKCPLYTYNEVPQQYCCTVKFDSSTATGTGLSKKEAKNEAAKQMFLQLRKQNIHDEIDVKPNVTTPVVLPDAKQSVSWV